MIYPGTLKDTKTNTRAIVSLHQIKRDSVPSVNNNDISISQARRKKSGGYRSGSIVYPVENAFNRVKRR
jgi:hypothetical protein